MMCAYTMYTYKWKIPIHSDENGSGEKIKCIIQILSEELCRILYLKGMRLSGIKLTVSHN